MTHAPARDNLRIISYWCGREEGWLSLGEGASDSEAAALAEDHADTPEARAFLAKSLVSINRDAAGTVGQWFAYVPDRNTGEVVVFGQSAAILLPSVQEATAEAYAARSPQTVGGRKFKVLDHSAIVVQCPAGPAACVATLQRQRYTTSIFQVVEIVVFPEYEGLREGVQTILYSSHLDLMEDVGTWCREMANSSGADVGYADGTVLASFGIPPGQGGIDVGPNPEVWRRDGPGLALGDSAG